MRETVVRHLEWKLYRQKRITFVIFSSESFFVTLILFLPKHFLISSGWLYLTSCVIKKVVFMNVEWDQMKRFSRLTCTHDWDNVERLLMPLNNKTWPKSVKPISTSPVDATFVKMGKVKTLRYEDDGPIARCHKCFPELVNRPMLLRNQMAQKVFYEHSCPHLVQYSRWYSGCLVQSYPGRPTTTTLLSLIA